MDTTPTPPPAPTPQPKTAPLPWSGAKSVKEPAITETPVVVYAPLHETLRIFAGWLLAWYGLIYALGFLEVSGKLPSLPFVHELFLSRVVLGFTFVTFLFLAASNIHKWMGGGRMKGLLLTIASLVILAGFVAYS